MTKSIKGPIFWVAYSVAAAALNVTVGFLDDSWLNYAFAALLAACVIPNILVIKQRKAAPAVASSDLSRYLSSGYSSGGYISRPYTTPKPSSPSKPSAPGEFKGIPFDFAVGEVYGLRMWRMDGYGRLRARNWEKAPAWRPGVNVAKCVEQSDYDSLTQSMLRQFGLATGTASPKPEPKPPHDTPSEDCACGFHAYTESRHAETLPYKDSHVVLGIVKGTGRTLMGTKGFRCEKAEIVAFRDPTRGGTKDEPWRVEQLANLKRVYPDVPILESRAALLEFAPLTNTLPDPSTDEFWNLP